MGESPPEEVGIAELVPEAGLQIDEPRWTHAGGGYSL
jgi:hypothetical protein